MISGESIGSYFAASANHCDGVFFVSIPQRELKELYATLLLIDSGESSEEAQHRLSELLARYPEASVEVAELLDQQAALLDAGQITPTAKLPVECSEGDAIHGILSARRRRDTGKASAGLSPLLAGCLVLTHLATAALVWVVLGLSAEQLDSTLADRGTNRNDSKAFPGTDASSSKPHLTAMTGCVWDERETTNVRVGQQVDVGQVLHLQEGIVALDLGRGADLYAKIRVEGPARLSVRQDGLLELNYGSMTADVRGESSDLRMVTGEVEFEMSGTASVGVSATSERSEIHVFEGSVKLSPRQADQGADLIELVRGEAATVWGDRSGKASVVRSKASGNPFVSSRSMATDRLEIGAAYVNAVLEAKPDVYWRFEDIGDQVSNQGQLEGFVGNVGGSVGWDASVENRSLEFGFRKSPGLLISAGVWPREPLDEYTVQFWAKPSHYHRGTMVSLVDEPLPDGQSPQSLLLEVSGPHEPYYEQVPMNALRFSHRAIPSTGPGEEGECYSMTTYSVRRWQQIVARKSGSRLELFRDGEVIASAECAQPLPAGTRVLIGQLFPVLHKANERIAHRPYVGQIDEIAIYSRALTDDEIRRHHELGRQYPTKGDSI